MNFNITIQKDPIYGERNQVVTAIALSSRIGKVFDLGFTRIKKDLKDINLKKYSGT